MRITIRLDDSLHDRLRQVAGRDGVTLSEAANRAIKRGLAPSVREIFRPRPMGIPNSGFDLSRANALADELGD